MVRYKSYAITHPGNVRRHNQDAYYTTDDKGLWAIADGMGGHRAGDVASETIIQAIDNLAKASKDNIDILTLTSILEDVNEQLFKHSQENQCISGSTIAIILAEDNYATCLWAGDTRVYLYRQETLYQVSRDHNYVQELLDKNEITPEQAEHFKKNVLTRAVGVSEKLLFDYADITLLSGDKLLLCSDGLYNEVSPQEIRAILSYTDKKNTVDSLLDLALNRTAKDNITAIILEIDEHE